MREVCVFLSPTLYKTNDALVEGLKKNSIAVSILDAQDADYEQAIQEHSNRVKQANSDQAQKTYQPRLCLAFEDTPKGVRKANKAGMCSIGIGGNHIEMEHLRNEGALLVSQSIASLLHDFHIQSYYQIQYLPYAIQLRILADEKVGYPVSLLDTLGGRFVEHDDTSSDEEEDYGSVQKSSYFELDPQGQRIIPRQVLGIQPGSLADVYINNVGWPQDNIESFFLETHELEMDIVRMFGRFYNCPDGLLRGFVTSGGTEGNFSGLWWNRDYLHNRTGVAPIFLASDETHYSIRKAAQQLAIDFRPMATNNNGEMDCEKLEDILEQIAIQEPDRPILVNVNLGTTQTGALDDLPMIHKLLVDKVKARGQAFAIHADAALMGACLPIQNPFGDINYFQDLEVNTMAISGHKFFGSVCICGLCLTTSSFLDECSKLRATGVNYIEGLHDITPSGSRSGFNTLSLHNTLCGLDMHTDCSRLQALVMQCYQNVDYFKREMVEMIGPDKVIHPPNSLNVCFPRPSQSLMSHYQLMPVTLSNRNEKMAGVCILINMSRAKIDRFLGDYSRDLVRHRRNEPTIRHLFVNP